MENKRNNLTALPLKTTGALPRLTSKVLIDEALGAMVVGPQKPPDHCGEDLRSPIRRRDPQIRPGQAPAFLW